MIYRILNIFFFVTSLLIFTGIVILKWSFWPLLLVIFLYAGIMLVLSTNIRLNFFVKAFNNNPCYKENAVALSFDDGPSENTLQLLDILDEYKAKAAFFCVGKKIEEYPEIFKEIIKRGHIVGNHTYSHTRKMGFVSSERIFDEITRCNKIAQGIAGVDMNLFRPPFGVINPRTKQALELTGHQVIGWNVRPYDAITKSPEVILNRITRKLKSGDVILLHDNIKKTATVLEQLLVILKHRNLSVVRPDKFFGINAYN